MRRIAAALILACLIFAVLIVPVFATTTIPNPSSITISSAEVVRNTIEPGDLALAFQFKLAYTNYPTTVTATDSFYLRLYDPTGVTVLFETHPYACIDYGYNDNIAGLYVSAADVTTDGLVWGTAYKIAIVPVSAYFSSPPSNVYYTLQSTDYTTVTAKTDAQKVMADYIRKMFYAFEQTYSGLQILTTSDVGDVLTSDGENWLRGAFPGVASIAPALFYVQYYVPTATNMNYNSSLGATYAGRSASWDITTGLSWLATQTGLDSAGTVALFINIGICLVFTIFCAWKGWGVEPGLLGSLMILEDGALLFGGSLLNAVLFLTLIMGIFIMYILFLRRA